jgi:predicted type IV restriction endonuclease
MASIPKKVAERFNRAIPKFQKVLQIAKDRDVNESDTVSVLNDILGELFGYDKYLEVTSEFSIRGTYCDLAIKIDDKVHFLIEAKAIGIELKENHIKQAVDYGANHGVQWVILTNAVEWRAYRIRFEQPINFDLVVSFDFRTLNPRDEKDQDILFLLAKEGLEKNVREDFYEKVQSVNRFVIGNLLLAEPVITTVRRELKKLAEGVKIEADEIEQIMRAEVLKREIVEGDQADAAAARVNKFYRKTSAPRRIKKEEEIKAPSDPPAKEESVTDRLLREAAEPEKCQPEGTNESQ